jgi:hypothetical protein
MSTMSTDNGLTAETFHKGTMEKRQQFRPPQNSTKSQAGYPFLRELKRRIMGRSSKEQQL